MVWTRTEIRALIRQLTGIRSSAEWSDSDLDAALNQYYQNVFPVVSRLDDFEGFYSFNTVASTGSYAIPDTVLSVDEPVTVDDNDGDAVNELTLRRDNTGFFRDFVEDDSATEQEPTQILVWNRYFWPRPIPDAVYTIKMPALQKPTAISDSNLSPLRDAWGPALAYGTAIQKLIDTKDTDGAAALTPMYEAHLHLIIATELGQLVGMRAAPRF